ncbi:MAG: YidH family protein [Marmoricola sp.]
MSQSADEEPDVRFSLANERTLLAYQRTSIGLIGAAVAVAHFLDDSTLALVLASILLLCGAVSAVGGYQRYVAADRAIREGRPLGPGRAAMLLSVGLIVAVVVAAIYVGTTAG